MVLTVSLPSLHSTQAWQYTQGWPTLRYCGPITHSTLSTKLQSLYPFFCGRWRCCPTPVCRARRGMK